MGEKKRERSKKSGRDVRNVEGKEEKTRESERKGERGKLQREKPQRRNHKREGERERQQYNLIIHKEIRYTSQSSSLLIYMAVKSLALIYKKSNSKQTFLLI